GLPQPGSEQGRARGACRQGIDSRAARGSRGSRRLSSGLQAQARIPRDATPPRPGCQRPGPRRLPPLSFGLRPLPKAGNNEGGALAAPLLDDSDAWFQAAYAFLQVRSASSADFESVKKSRSSAGGASATGSLGEVRRGPSRLPPNVVRGLCPRSVS